MKKIIIGIAIIISLILLVPLPLYIKDGGSVEFKAVLYSVTKYHTLDERSESGYNDGWGVKILGMEVFYDRRNSD